MLTFVIEKDGAIKDAFSYEIPLNEASHFALCQYARANYGSDAMVRDDGSRESAIHGARFGGPRKTLFLNASSNSQIAT